MLVVVGSMFVYINVIREHESNDNEKAKYKKLQAMNTLLDCMIMSIVPFGCGCAWGYFDWMLCHILAH